MERYLKQKYPDILKEFKEWKLNRMRKYKRERAKKHYMPVSLIRD